MTDDGWEVPPDWDTEEQCPVCHSNKLVPAFGPQKAKILLVAEYPGEEEIKQGVPMVGPMSNVLKTELAYAGLDFRTMRRMNVWQHSPNKNKDCFANGVEKVIKEAKNRHAILLIGSDTVKYFCDLPVTNVCGLQVKSSYLSAPIIVACINPAIVFRGGHGVGEIRLALKRFADLVK